MARMDDAIQQLYEDPKLREDLTDAEAEALFAWAEGEVRRLDAQHPDEDTFQAAVEALLATAGDLNAIVGRRGADGNAQVAHLDRLSQDAADAGLNVDRAYLGRAVNDLPFSAQSAGRGGEQDDPLGSSANIALIGQLTAALSSPMRAAPALDAAAQFAVPASAALPVASPTQTAVEADLGLPAGSMAHMGAPAENMRSTTADAGQSRDDTSRAVSSGSADLRTRMRAADGTEPDAEAESEVRTSNNPIAILGEALGGLFNSSAPTPTPPPTEPTLQPTEELDDETHR